MEAAIDNRVKDTLQGNENLMRMLDRGIDDMEAERELPLDEAFQKIYCKRGGWDDDTDKGRSRGIT